MRRRFLLIALDLPSFSGSVLKWTAFVGAVGDLASTSLGEVDGRPLVLESSRAVNSIAATPEKMTEMKKSDVITLSDVGGCVPGGLSMKLSCV